MEMTNKDRIEAPRATVWAALNDVEVLKSCVPGCEELVKHSDTEFTAKVTLKIGPVKAAFKGKMQLLDVHAPSSYTISFEGQGGVAGFAKGTATVMLEEDGTDASVLHYTARAMVGGKIAQLGARLVDSSAAKLAAEFFARFGEIVRSKSARS
jgi:uncharacterized protein